MVFMVLTTNMYNTVTLNKKLICEKNNETFQNIISERFEDLEEAFTVVKPLEIVKSGSDLLESLGFNKDVILTEPQMLLFTAIFLEYGPKLVKDYTYIPMYLSSRKFCWEFPNESLTYYTVQSVYTDIILYWCRSANNKEDTLGHLKLLIDSIHFEIIKSINESNYEELKCNLLYLNELNSKFFSKNHFKFFTRIDIDYLDKEAYNEFKINNNIFFSNYHCKFLTRMDIDDKLLNNFNSKFLWASLLVGTFAVYSFNNL